MPTSQNGTSFYATTPIFYVNDAPHIGHAYTEVAADVLTRWHRARGENAFLLTGTDEHGEKILRTAVANKMEPQAWADQLVRDSWLPLLETIDIDNQDFIRTTEPRHEKNVQKFLQHLYDTGFIYRGSYEGNYCVGCEEYKTDADLIDGEGAFEGQAVCAIHTRPVEKLQETNYFFKLSEFQDRLLRIDPDFYPAGIRSQRGRLVRSPRPRRPLHLALEREVRLGNRHPLGRLSHHLRVVRRTAELHHRHRLRRGRRQVRNLLASQCAGRR
jgi:methionyl-tRNA synthetase